MNVDHAASFCGWWEQLSSICSDFSEQLALSHALPYLVMHHEKIKVNQSTLHLEAKGFYFISCKKKGMGLGGEAHCSKQRPEGSSPLCLSYPSWNIIMPTVNGKRKVRKLVLRGKYGLAKGLGVTVLVPRLQDTAAPVGGWWPEPQLFMACGLPAQLPSSQERMEWWFCWNDHPRRNTEAAHLSGCCGPFLNTRMVCSSAALALSSNWCHQDKHYLKIKHGCVNIDYFSLLLLFLVATKNNLQFITTMTSPAE